MKTMWFYPFVSTGKEKDTETGYGYFGARYMDHELMTMWLSVDPLADKYPSISPYAYCAWNPVKLMDPDGREVGWYVDVLGNVIGKDGVDDDRIYLVINESDVKRIKRDGFQNGVSRESLKGDVTEIPSYEARQELKEIYNLGKENKTKTGEYGMLIFSNEEKELGIATYHSNTPIEISDNGSIRGVLRWNIRERIGYRGFLCESNDNLIIMAHTHNVDDNKPHPPTILEDVVPKGVIGVVFDYQSNYSNAYIYDDNTRYRSRSCMSSSVFFKPFIAPGGKAL